MELPKIIEKRKKAYWTEQRFVRVFDGGQIWITDEDGARVCLLMFDSGVFYEGVDELEAKRAGVELDKEGKWNPFQAAQTLHHLLRSEVEKEEEEADFGTGAPFGGGKIRKSIAEHLYLAGEKKWVADNAAQRIVEGCRISAKDMEEAHEDEANRASKDRAWFEKGALWAEAFILGPKEEKKKD